MVQPQDAEGENAVDRGHGLLIVDRDHGPRLPGAGQQAARVSRAKRSFEIHGGAERFGPPAFVAKLAGERAFEQLQVPRPRGLARAWGAAIFFGRKFEDGRLRLAEAVAGQTQKFTPGRRGGDAADEVRFLAPKVQRAAGVLGRKAVFCSAKIEQDLAVFAQHRRGELPQVVVERGRDLLGCLIG